MIKKSFKFYSSRERYSWLLVDDKRVDVLVTAVDIFETSFGVFL